MLNPKPPGEAGFMVFINQHGKAWKPTHWFNSTECARWVRNAWAHAGVLARYAPAMKPEGYAGPSDCRKIIVELSSIERDCRMSQFREDFNAEV